VPFSHKLIKTEIILPFILLQDNLKTMKRITLRLYWKLLLLLLFGEWTFLMNT